MSQRVKRPNRSDDGSVPAKRRKRPTTCTQQEEEDTASLASWRPPLNHDLKTIYNRLSAEAPAELFRKDLISAMKLPDSEPLACDEYWVIVDQWKQEWERGVQVPVNPDSLPEPSVTVTQCSGGGGGGVDRVKPSQDFKLPKNKYVRITKDDHFKSEEHIFSSAPAQAEAACSYDLDECDVEWLKLLNAERLASGQGTITEDQLERVMERLELRCWDKIQSILKTEEGLGIEFDENVICDVCRSPDSEEGNEMVFCDSCNICVHQACYGITQIPEGQWLCCTCALSKRPECVLCPNKGGAMKCTKSGLKWAHVSCALWIPEVSIGCVEKMEPITKISSIPQSRWALICVLCRDRIGACIQCSVKTCKTAYHVTCAFKHGLEMRAIIEDENADDGVKLRSYCEKHSKSSKKEKNVCSSSEDDDSKRKKRKDMTSEEKNQARAARSHEIEAEFYKHVSAKDIAVQIEVDSEALQYIYNYWKLKRKAGHNKPLLPPKSEDIDMLSHQQEQADLEKMKMFVQLRQDLERVRNLCYMVSRREKLSRSFFKLREQTFYKQVSVIQSANGTLTSSVLEAVLEANHGPSIYDTLYSNGVPEDNTCNFNTILARIAGSTSPTPNDQKSDVNGLFKDVKNNPYKKLYFNGSSKRKSGSLYGSGLSSAGSSDEQPKDNKENRLLSSEEDVKPVLTSSRKKVQNKKSISKKRYSANISKIDSSSEEDVKDVKSITKLYNNSGLKQIENELSISASDSDELILISSKNINQKKSVNSIYSDTDSTDVSLKNDDRSSNADSQQSRLRTKAAVKDFSHKIGTKSPTKGGSDFKRRVKEEKKSDTKKKDPFDASELIVPQRQAAKKASENLKSTTGRTKEHAMSNDVEAISAAPNEEKERHNKNKLKLGRPHKEKEKNVKHETHSEVKCKEDTKIRDDKCKDSKKDVDKDAKIEVDIDKDVEKNDPDVLAYVPQRQAAKKAAEHIKSGLGKPGVQDIQPVVDDKEKVKKEAESTRLRKENEVKLSKESEKSKRIIEHTHKSSSNSTSSSSSSSSTDSSCSSTSDSEDVSVRKPRSESHLAALDNKRTTEAKDWPFLDKGAKSTASISSTDTSDSSRSTSPKSHALSKSEQKAKSTNLYSENLSKEPQDVAVVTDHKNDHRERSQQQQQQQQPAEKHISRTSPDKSSSKTVDKKPAVVKREEPVRNRGKAAKSSRGRARITNTCDRIGSVDVRSGDLTECSSNKPDQSKARTRKSDSGISDKTIQSNSTCSPLRENDQKVLDTTEPEPSYLEKEILERKANRDSMGKSRLDQIFSPIDKSDVQSTSSFKIRQPTFRELDTITIEPDKSPISEENLDDGLMTRSPILHKSLDEYTDKKVDDPVKLIELENDILSNTSEIKHSETLTSQSDVLDEISFEKEETKESNIQSDLFSNQKDQDLLADFDNILDDGFDMSKDDEPINTNLSFSFGNVPYIKEDSKEESARETLNLVEKLRMGLSKKSTSCDVEDTVSVSSSSKNDTDRIDLCEQIVPNNIIESSLSKENIAKIVEQPQINLEMKVEVTDTSTFQSAKEQNYNFLSCNADVPLVSAELPQKECNVDDRHTVTTEADERWVPPSNLSSNATSPKIIPGASTPLIVEPYIQNDYQSQSSVSLPLQSRSIDDIKTPDRRITQTPFLDPASMDYTAMDIHPSAKWNENHLMPSRRSSSSSNSSTRSNSPQRIELNDENVFKRQEMMNHPIDMAYNLPPFQPNAIDSFPQFSEASQFVSTPVSLFPPSGITTQLPFPSPGTPIFPPSYGATYQPPHSVIETMSKPTEEPMSFSTACTAAFTSSHHNMAFTAAMVNMRKDTLPNENTSELSSSNPMLDISNEDILPSSIINYNATSYVEPSPNPSVKSNSSTGKKSPSKPTRTSARFISLQQSKSPSKSPAKSPRQEHAKRSSRGKGVASRGNQNQSRGRGRGKGRGKSISQPEHDNPYTIHNKLIGTVYDLNFDDDISKDNMADLRAMRERRKSVDVHDRKSDTPKEISMSPKFQSPSQSYKNKSFNTDLRDLRPPTPIKEPPKAISPEPTPVFTDIVQPVLPGPVDMRTYNNTFESHNYESNLLTAFGTGTAQQLHEDIDEELEKEFHSALTAVNKKIEEPAPVLEISNMKVSLSDSRNQLKVKIKGPIANYTSSVIPPLPPVIDALIPSNTSIASVSNNSMLNSTPNMSTGTSNLRRMRKKELLRQYCSQDMNMDDPVQVSGFPPVITPSISRTIITIPKAVASMTTIPTKDDYRDYRTSTEDILDTKIRKEKSRPGLSRELRQLDVVLDDDNSRRHTTMNMTSINLVSNDSKRRGRPPRSIQSNVAPKLKIKIGGNSIVGPTRIDDKRDRIRPPKKRLSIIAMPTVEDLKRESMKFRKQIMADFGEKRKKDKDKGDKKNKKKKKQDKQAQIVANETSNPTKLIIRFGKKMESDSENKRSDSGVEVDNSNISEDREKSSLSLSGENTNCEVDHQQMGERVVNRANSSETSTLSLRAVRSSKVSPIKLKLSRCQKGSGYVMKGDSEDGPPRDPLASAIPLDLLHTTTSSSPPPPSPTTPLLHNVQALASSPPPPPPPPTPSLIHQPTPLPALPKDCEVR